MGKKKGKDDAAEGKKGGKSKIIIIVAVIGLGAGGYVMGTKSSAPAADPNATTTTALQKPGCSTTSLHEAPKTVVDLPSMSINLQDGHYLRIAVSLGLCDDIVVTEEEPFPTAPAKDIIVANLSGGDMDELSTEAGREQAKEILHEQILEAYPAEVYEVWFSEFVMQ